MSCLESGKRIGKLGSQRWPVDFAVRVAGQIVAHLDACRDHVAGHLAATDSEYLGIGGIGGCPFAPAATGNIPTDDLLYMLDRSGVDTGVSLDKIIEVSNWLEQELGRGVPALLPKAGTFPRAASH